MTSGPERNNQSQSGREAGRWKRRETMIKQICTNCVVTLAVIAVGIEDEEFHLGSAHASGVGGWV